MKTKTKKIIGISLIVCFLAAAFTVGFTCGFFNNLFAEKTASYSQSEFKIDSMGRTEKIVLKNVSFDSDSYQATLSGCIAENDTTVNLPDQDVSFHELFGEWWYVNAVDEAGQIRIIFAHRLGKGAVLGQQEVSLGGKKETAERFNRYEDISYFYCGEYEYLFYKKVLDSEEKEKEEEEPWQNQLVGYYVASEAIDFCEGDVTNLFDLAELAKIISSEEGSNGGLVTISADNEIRLYAQKTANDEGDYDISFSQGKGVFFLFRKTKKQDKNGSDYVSYSNYGEVELVHSSLSNTGASCEGTVHFARSENGCYFFYEVYETDDENYYITTARTSYGVDANDSCYSGSHSVTQTYTQTVNGTESAFTVSFKLHFDWIEEPEKTITVKEMDENDAVLSVLSFTNLTAPESLVLSSDTAYLLIEQTEQGNDGNPVLTRTIITEEDWGIPYYVVNENGFGIGYNIELTWE